MIRREFNGRLEPQFNPFQEDYLAEILEAACLAWARIQQPSRSEIEDRITARLAGLLANDPHFEEIPYEVTTQHVLLGPKGELLGRLDLRFKHRYSRRDYFAFESKRLHVTYPGGKFSAEYSSYSGSQGMMAFVKGQYSKGFPAGGMLGYVMDGRSDKAWNGLERRIDLSRKPLKLIKGSTLAKCSLSKNFVTTIEGIHLGETEHNLATHKLRLFHLLLPVRSQRSLSKRNR